MADARAIATLIDSTTSKIQLLQQAFSELENHRAVSLNLKWKELEEHFRGLEMSLKKKYNELEDQERVYEAKVLESQEALQKRGAVVAAKEHSSLEQLQTKRDTAISAIEDAIQSQKKSSVVTDDDSSKGHVDIILEDKSDVYVDKTDCENIYSMQSDTVDPLVSSPLFKLCKEMDAKGIHKFISDNRKNLATIRELIPAALRKASNAFQLVLDSLKDFYTVETTVADGKKDSTLLGLRRTCLMLMESLSLMLADGQLGSGPGNLMICPGIKLQAKAIADDWKPKLNELDICASGGNSLEVHAFLQLIATFGIASHYDEDEISNLIPSVSRRRQTAGLCRSLGLLHRMPGLTELLIKSGRQLEAVNLAYAFGLTERFPPVPLLKAFLKEAKTVSQIKVAAVSPDIENDTSEREHCALKAIVKCIEEHKLEEQYPTEPLQKRIQQLEKAKADKKRAAEVAKPQSKRPRATGINFGLNGCGYGLRITNVPEKNVYRPPERYQYAYDRQYMHPAEAHPSPIMGSPYNVSPSHGAFNASPTPSHGTYYSTGYQYHTQAPYIH